jgi:hypothetical protein
MLLRVVLSGKVKAASRAFVEAGVNAQGKGGYAREQLLPGE